MFVMEVAKETKERKTPNSTYLALRLACWGRYVNNRATTLAFPLEKFL